MKKIKTLALIAGFTFLVACKNSGDSPAPSGVDIAFYQADPLEVDLNGTKPRINGVVESEAMLKDFKAYAVLSNGTQNLLFEEAIEASTSYEFSVQPVYSNLLKSVLVEVSTIEGQKASGSLNILVEQLPEVDGQPITDKDAFPGAEGHGRYTTGGRGGKVLVVETLEDTSSPGSLRWAIERSGARTIVFKVAGTIHLTSPLKVANGDVTIAGQSAPGDGICIAGDYLQLNDGVQNVIIRYLRFRNARGYGEYDAAWGRNGEHIILDHCSFSWGNDEVASFYDNRHFTMQWCIISESFYNSTHPKGMHGYGGIWGGLGASFHHNLIAHHTSRNPRFCGARFHLDTRDEEVVDFRNNVIYNWGGNSAYGGEYGQHNMVNNYFKAGPATSSSKRNRIVEISDADSKWYIEGNTVHGYSEISADNWAGGVQGNSTAEGVRVFTPYETGAIVTQTAPEAYVSVLQKAGASYRRDVIDARLADEVSKGTATYGGATYGAGKGIIDSENDTEGYPEYEAYDGSTDHDYDGMDDDWETANGLDPTNGKDHSAFTLSDDYTNLEMYLNSLVE